MADRPNSPLGPVHGQRRERWSGVATGPNSSRQSRSSGLVTLLQHCWRIVVARPFDFSGQQQSRSFIRVAVTCWCSSSRKSNRADRSIVFARRAGRPSSALPRRCKFAGEGLGNAGFRIKRFDAAHTPTVWIAAGTAAFHRFHRYRHDAIKGSDPQLKHAFLQRTPAWATNRLPGAGIAGDGHRRE